MYYFLHYVLSYAFFKHCFSFILYSHFLNVSTNLYNTAHYVRAIEILHFWQLLINVFLVVLAFKDFYLILANIK